MEVLYHYVSCPIILISVANNYGIYLVARYQELRGYDLPVKPGKWSVITGSLNMPILFSGLTTVAGLLACCSFNYSARQVGVLAATGVTLAWQ